MKSKWYLAYLIEFPIIRNNKTLKLNKYTQYLYWENLVLIKAINPNKAYDKANKVGKEYEYKTINNEGDFLEWKFAGIRELIEVGETIADKEELTFIEDYEKSFKAIRNLVPHKNKLLAFKNHEKNILDKRTKRNKRINFKVISNELRNNSILAEQKIGKLNNLI